MLSVWKRQSRPILLRFLGSPLTFSEYISKKVKDQIADGIRNRDVLEMDSSIKVFKQAWGWLKLIFGIAVGFLILTGGGVIWKASDFWTLIKQSNRSSILQKTAMTRFHVPLRRLRKILHERRTMSLSNLRG